MTLKCWLEVTQGHLKSTNLVIKSSQPGNFQCLLGFSLYYLVVFISDIVNILALTELLKNLFCVLFSIRVSLD